MHTPLTEAITLAIGNIADWMEWPENRHAVVDDKNLIVIERFFADTLRVSEQTLSGGRPAYSSEPFYVVVTDGAVTKIFEGNQPQPASEKRIEHLCTMLNRLALAKASIAAPSLTRNRISYSVCEAASLLGVGLSTLYDAVKRGEVPNCGVGRTVRINGRWLQEKLV